VTEQLSPAVEAISATAQLIEDAERVVGKDAEALWAYLSPRLPVYVVRPNLRDIIRCAIEIYTGEALRPERASP
jgi:hypothetical protein